MAKLGIALEWGSRGPEFESQHSDHEKRLKFKDVRRFFRCDSAAEIGIWNLYGIGSGSSFKTRFSGPCEKHCNTGLFQNSLGSIRSSPKLKLGRVPGRQEKSNLKTAVSFGSAMLWRTARGSLLSMVF